MLFLRSLRRGAVGRTLRDVRVGIFGILGVLVLATVVVRWRGPEARLLAFLRTLPPSVSAVVIEGREPSRARALLATLLPLPPPSLPPRVHALATLIVQGDSSPSPLGTSALSGLPVAEHAVALLDPAAAARIGVSGMALAGFTAVGDPAVLEHLRTVSTNVGEPVPPPLLRFLRHSTASGVRVLARNAWVTLRLRALSETVGIRVGDPTHSSVSPLLSPQAFLAVLLEGDARTFRFRGVLSGDFTTWDTAARVLLTSPPSGALLVLDGLPASEVLPEDLPPILDVLRRESGAAEEIRSLSRTLQSTPLLLVLRSGPLGTAEFILGITRPRGEAGGILAEEVRALLERRRNVSRAVVEHVRVGAEVVRHQRPGPAPALTEETEGPWRFLAAPGAAGTLDLVAAFHDHVMLLGTSRDGFRKVAEVVRREPLASMGDLRQFQSRFESEGPDVQLFLDGERLRRIPAVAFALRGLPARVASWIETLLLLRFELTFRQHTLEFSGTAELRLPM